MSNTRSISISIDKLVLKDFPAVDVKLFAHSFKTELRSLMKSNAQNYDWHKLYTTTCFDAGLIESHKQQSAQQLGKEVAKQLCHGLFRSKD